MTNHRRIALALNNLATVLQQLAVEVDTAARATRVVIPEGQLSVEELRAQLAAGVLTAPEAERSLFRLAEGSEPASVAEPECGCSLYTRCDAHSRDPRCKCNGPRFRASSCLQSAHREEARAKPDRDPALAD